MTATTTTAVISLALNVAGRFEASSPFDQVVNTADYYTVQALRNFHEMEANKVDIYTLVFAPVGVSIDDYPTVLSRAKTAGATVAVLMDNTNSPVYVVTSYLTSFPLIDGVSYERMCIIADCGSVPATMSTTLAQAVEHFGQYLLDVMGVTSTVNLGTIPTIGYVTADQATAYETTRLSLIKDGTSDLAQIRTLNATTATQTTYIAQLEAQIALLSATPAVVTPVTPTV
jgi:hypothetical protein